MIPDRITAFSVSVAGRALPGRVRDVKPPDLKIRTQDYRPAGFDAPVKVDVGMDPLDLEWQQQGPNRETVALFGVRENGGVQVEILGSVQRPDGTEAPLLIDATGVIQSVVDGTWTPGEKAPLKIMMNCTYYRRTQDGVEVAEIDIPNGIRTIGGVDQLADRRANIGG